MPAPQLPPPRPSTPVDLVDGPDRPGTHYCDTPAECNAPLYTIYTLSSLMSLEVAIRRSADWRALTLSRSANAGRWMAIWSHSDKADAPSRRRSSGGDACGSRLGVRVQIGARSCACLLASGAPTTLELWRTGSGLQARLSFPPRRRLDVQGKRQVTLAPTGRKKRPRSHRAAGSRMQRPRISRAAVIDQIILFRRALAPAGSATWVMRVPSASRKA